MNGDDIKWLNDTMPVFPDGMPLRYRILCLLGYHKRETRNAPPDYKGRAADGSPIDLGGMRLRDQCGRCHAGL
jgi:hypothetical protein